MEERLYQVALELVPGIGDTSAKNLIAYSGSASSIFKATTAQLKKIPGIGAKTIEALQSSDVLKEAEEIIQACDQQGIQIHHYTDSAYPQKLKQAVDAPNLIYSKGKLEQWDRVMAIVGTRNATPYGREVTERIVEESKSLNALIVSGLAYGIDITAHRAALKHQIPTTGVLAGGLDRVYPSVHKKTAEEMMEAAALISENPPGTQPDPHFFPARNRIIAGMSDVVIVVEAAKKGGALITAHIADSYDRTVFAVPGDLNHTYSEGCNYLIRNQKAQIYTSVADIRYHLNWDETSHPPTKPSWDLSGLSEPERAVCLILKDWPAGIPIDELAWRSQIPINQLASHLLSLEFQGMVKSLPGKKYQLR